MLFQDLVAGVPANDADPTVRDSLELATATCQRWRVRGDWAHSRRGQILRELRSMRPAWMEPLLAHRNRVRASLGARAKYYHLIVRKDMQEEQIC
jgi:hypothetical protein